jgi:hypothetical protein
MRREEERRKESSSYAKPKIKLKGMREGKEGWRREVGGR